MIVLGFGISIAQLFMGKTCPEDYGMLPDGETSSSLGLPQECPVQAPPKLNSLRPVLADSRFWIMALSYSLAVTAEMMAFMHQVAYATDNQIEKVAAASSVGLVGVASILGRFFFGWLSDRIRDAKYAACLGFIFMAVGICVLMHTRTAAVLFVYAMLFGFGYGSMSPMMPFLLADRFGRQVLASSYGMLAFFAGIGGGVGPLLGGIIYDRLGSYNFAWKLDIAILVAVTFLILLLKPRENRTATLHQS